MDDCFTYKKIIYEVYKEKSFSKAAKKLFISQPSLSLCVSKTEKMIGLPLFDRSSLPITLTDAGKEYIRAVEGINALEEAFKDYVDQETSLKSGHLRIGCNQLLATLVLPSFVTNFVREYPSIGIEIADADTTSLREKISSGDVDLIIDNKAQDERIFTNLNLHTETLLLAVPRTLELNAAYKEYQLNRDDIIGKRHRSELVKEVPLEILQDLPFIAMSKDNDLRDRTDEIIRSGHVFPRVLLELDRLSTVYRFITLGLAASVVSDTLVRNTVVDNQDNVVFYKLSGEIVHRDIYLTYKNSKYVSKAMKGFIKEAREHLFM